MTVSTGVRAVLVSAAASGQGKTTVTAALARKLVNRGLRVRVFKTGPDFLDPMMLGLASRAAVETLDLYIVGPERCGRLLAQAADEADAILIEGVMGLYDGSPSSADLARPFGVPVMAAIDASAMAQTAGALVMGLRDYGPVELAGVIANRVGSAAHAGMVKEALRGVPLTGTLARQPASLPERHLGLVQPGEVDGIDRLLDELAEQLQIDEAAWDSLPAVTFSATGQAEKIGQPLHGKTIAVARDAAFAFLYPSNLACLEELGANLTFFSPLDDEPVPRDADAVYLPGGYPELHARTLSQAGRWQASIRAFHAARKPVFAECGGMMALAESLSDMEGKAWPMAGLLAGRMSMQTRLAALGSQAWRTPQGQLRGHAYHYSRFDTPLVPAAHAVKHSSGQEGEAVYRDGALTATYFHPYFPSCPPAAARLFFKEET